MRTVSAETIRDTVAELCIEANRRLPADVEAALKAASKAENWPIAENCLRLLEQNLLTAPEKELPICQDTGLACVFIELGQDVHIEGSLSKAVNEGVAKGYTEGYLRKSAVEPLRRVNTEDNSPALLHVELVEGDGCRVTVMPKGFGSENMSRIAMLRPADGIEGVKRFVIDTVAAAGGNPCPPIVVGIGIGGNFETCAQLAKKALTRDISSSNDKPESSATPV